MDIRSRVNGAHCLLMAVIVMRDGGGRVNMGVFAPHVMGRNGANRGFGFIWLGY